MTDLLDRLKRALADRYAIEREIGSGGMATVYLAEDLKLHRKVALKVLRPELAAALGPQRFLREIEIAAKLHHPHILALHDSGEADGFLYYVMPYVEGESLRDRLNREKQLPVEDAVQIAREVADALGSAHRHAVIHRDIKPENILLEEGHALVADFGIARAIRAAGGERLTETGMAVGTPAYMSPEQAMGNQELDGRSDLYSLGCVLYEMLGSEPPFTGATVESIVHQHIAVEPRPVTELRPAVPAEVVAALARVLSKAPADRFSPAAQFAEALSSAQTVPGAAVLRREKSRRQLIAYAAVAVLAILGVYTIVSRTVGLPESVEAAALPKLAVLPFDNLGSPQDEYFADGLTEEITSRIAQISGLLVISRQSAIQYKDSEKTLQQIGGELNVDYVLEGTIRTDRAPDGSGQVRVTPQLIRVSDDAHLWTDRYTANLAAGEVFGVQEQIANEVARELDVALLEPERERLTARPTVSQEAYDYFLRGNDYVRRSYEGRDRGIAVQMYRRAVELDPQFALAYARLSYVHSWMWWESHDRTQARLAMAREAVDEALRLDPDLPEAHEALGWYHYWGHRDYGRALAEFAVVVSSQPNNADVQSGIGAVLRRQGKTAEAVEHFLRAVELNPRSVEDIWGVAQTYTLLRSPAEASRYFDRAISLGPDWRQIHYQKAMQLHLRLEGDTESARAVLEQAESRGIGPLDIGWVTIYIVDGDYQAALNRLDRWTSDVAPDERLGWVLRWYAEIHDLMGNRERARAYYDSARIRLEAEIEEHPDEAYPRSTLGMAYAGMGRTADAIREGELATELLPVSVDAWYGAQRVEDLAHIYTIVGEYDAAIDQLEALLAVPSPTAVPMLRIDPTWNPLRDHPRFQALLEKYGN